MAGSWAVEWAAVMVDEKVALKGAARAVLRVALLGAEKAALKVVQRGWSAGQ